jgi:hypothetical protein
MVFVGTIELKSSECLVLAIDLQDKLIDSLDEGRTVSKRSEYLLLTALLLDVPILATTQNAKRLGPMAESLANLPQQTVDKTSFSCIRTLSIQKLLASSKARRIVLCGAETHICVALTALDLVDRGYSVAVCPDAVGASNLERHKLGMERMRDAGVVPVHSESVVYEWLESSDHPKFKDVLSLTKQLR